MTNEIELKLEVPPAMLRTLSNAAWLKRKAAGPIERQRLSSVYFDTASRSLRDAGLSLRVRQTGDSHVQTVKSGTDTFRRGEWERPLDGAMPDRRMARHTALKPFTSRKKWRKLRPVFETDIVRTSFPVHSGESRIEVALDRGQVKAGGERLAIGEIELELKQGKISDLNRLAARFVGDAALGLKSKAERGYGLADGTLADHAKASRIALGNDMSPEEGFRAIAFSCLHHLAANQQAVLGDDPEGVHQMRIGLRRLRAALSLFKPLIEGPELEKIKQDLKWVSGELGPARDFDVFVNETRSAVKRKPPGFSALEKDLTARRDKGFVRARQLVKSDRYRRIILQTGLWLTGGDWITSRAQMHRDLRQGRLVDLAQDILSARTAKVTRKLKKFDRMDDGERHKLRIAVKKLRYAAGFFESLFGHAHARKRFAAKLKALQEALGRLNDFRVHQAFARKTLRGKARLPRGAYALGVVRGQERAEAKVCLTAAARAGSRFAKQPKFWG